MKKLIVQTDLIDFGARVLSKTTDGLNAALGQLKENIASLPDKKAYLELSHEEQKEVEHSSLIFCFLEKSPGCKEIFDEMEEFHPSTNMFMILAEMLHLILENNFFLRTIGSNFTLCKQIVRSQVPKMNSLFENIKAGPTMASLLLLRTVAKTSQSAATDLVGALNLATFGTLFSHGIVHLKKTHQEMSSVWDQPMEEVRVYAVKVVFALLRIADTRLKDFLMGRDEKNARMVSLGFSRLTTYNRATVLEALDVLRNHVLRDRSLMRRVKTAFFSSQLLGDLGSLVHRYHDERVIEFVQYIVTDHFNGIVIPEEVWMPEDHSASSTGQKRSGADHDDDDDDDNRENPLQQHHHHQQNQMASWSSNVRFLGLLNALRPWRSTVQRDLALLILAECPRLAPLYFGQGPDNHFCSQFFPKNCSSSWLCSMALVRKYVQEYDIPLPGPWISEARAVELAERAVPGCPSLIQWRKCLASDFGLVRLASLDTLHAILVRLDQQLDRRRNRLCVMALDWIQVHRLPNVNLLQLLVSREKADAKNPGSEMILGSALRCLNLYHAIFSDSSQISDANWVGTLQSPWSRVPAIGLIAYTSHGWWQRGPAKDVFKMLVVDKKNTTSTLLRGAVVRTAQSLLQDTDLFGNSLFAGELNQWLNAIEQESDADLLVGTIARIMKAVPTAKHLEAKFNQELRKFASPVLLEICGLLYQKTNGSSLPKFQYLCRAVLALCHEAVVPVQLLKQLLEVLRLDSVLYESEGGADAQAIVAATSRFLDFIGNKLLKPPLGPGSLFVPGVTLKSSWWNDESLLLKLSPTAILAHMVFSGAPPDDSSVAEQHLMNGVDERLFCQALFYVERVRKLAGSPLESLCFRLLWTALEKDEVVVSSEVRQKLLLNRQVLEACLESGSVEAVLMLGECLISTQDHSFVGSVLLSAVDLRRVAPLLRYLHWSQLDASMVNGALERLLSAREWRLASVVVWSAWPGISLISRDWLEQFWNRANLRVATAAGSRNVAPPSNGTVLLAMESLRLTRDLDCVVLFWALLGIVVEPSLSLVKYLALNAVASSLAVSALLAVYSRLYSRVAAHIDEIVVARPSAAIVVALTPSVCLASRGAPTDERYRPLTSVLIQAAIAEQLPSAWLVEWKDKVYGIDKKLFCESIPPSFDIMASVLSRSHPLVGLSTLSYENKLRLLLPVVAVASPPDGSWKAVAACLRELKHVAQWGPDDASLQLLKIAVEYPCKDGFEALADAVRDERTDAGWVERACRELLSHECQNVSLAELLLVMVERRPNLCTRDFLGRIMSFYSCSCSRLDRVLLKIIRQCQRHGVELEAVGSFWGRPENATGGAEHLLYEGGLIKDAMLVNSIAEFPVDRLETEDGGEDLPGVYDPCFLLPYFYLALTRFEANCKRFADRGFLAYAIMGCSSAHEQVRRHAYSVIQAYWALLEASPSFSWKPQIRLLILSFKNAIVRPFQFVPSTVAVFLANYALILCQPSHHLYEMINHALLRRPVMELGTIPLLRDAFLGKCESTTRKWFLQTLGHGLKRGVDLKMLQEFHVIELLQSFFHHVADLDERVLIFKILQNCTRNPHLGRMLDQKFGILGWLSVSAETLMERQAAARLGVGLLTCWGSHASTQTRQLGWSVGTRLLLRAESSPQAVAALQLLSFCTGAVSSARESKDVLDHALRLETDVQLVLNGLAACRGAGKALSERLVSLLLDVGLTAVGDEIQQHVVEHVCACVATYGLQGQQALLKRLACAVLMARGSAGVSKATAVLSCLVARNCSDERLRARFENAMGSEENMLVLMTEMLY